MKNKSLIFFCLLIVVMIFIEEISFFSKELITTFFMHIIPSLMPAIMIDFLFINSSGLVYLCNLIKRKNKYSKTFYCFIIIILGLLGGTPSLANYVNDSIKQGIITKKEGQIILNAFVLPSFPYIRGVLIPYLSIRYKILLLVLLYIPPLIYYLLKFKIEKKEFMINDIKTPSNFFTKSFFDTFKTLTILISTMFLFSLPLVLFLKVFNENTAYSLIGLFEFSKSSLYLCSHFSISNFKILVILLTLSSLSIYTQISSFCPLIKIKEIIKTKIIFACINILLMYLFCFLQIF